MLFSILLLPALLFGQVDREFWFAAPGVTEDHGDRPILFRMSAQDAPTTVRVSLPAFPDFMPVVFDLEPLESKSVNLTGWIDTIECKYPFTTRPNGIHITATEPITAYYEVNRHNNPEIFTLKGSNALGTHFFSPNQSLWENSHHNDYSTKPMSSITIVATENATTVKFVVDENKHLSLPRKEVRLHRGETYVVSAVKEKQSLLTSGIEILSDKNIAVTIADDSQLHDRCADLGGDQIVPVDRTGTEFILAKGALEPNDIVFITATAENTQVKIHGSGNSNETRLNKGEQYVHQFLDDVIFIESSEPVYVLHATGNSCEIGQAIIPEVNCTGSNFVRFARSSELDLIVNLIAKKGTEQEMVLNSNSWDYNIRDWKTIPGNDEYVTALVKFRDRQPEGTVYTVSNPKGLFHLGIINGGRAFNGTPQGVRYGYLSNFQQLQVEGYQANVCLGDEIHLKAIGSDYYEWLFDDQTHQESELTFTPKEDIHIRLFGHFGSDDECIDSLGLFIDVADIPEIFIEPNPVCWNAESTFSLLDVDDQIARSIWVFEGNDTLIALQDDSVFFQPDRNKELLVDLIVTSQHHCVADTSVAFPVYGLEVLLPEIIESPQDVEVELHPKLDIPFSSRSNEENLFSLWSPEESFTCYTCLHSTLKADSSHFVYLKVEDESGCVDTASSYLSVDPRIYLPNAIVLSGNPTNQLLEPFGESLELQQIQIFDRWGGLVYMGNEPWNGFRGAEKVPEGQYVYKVVLWDYISAKQVVQAGEVMVFH